MPNRILKESICTSDNLNELTAEEERFFYRLMVNCDDYGRFDGRPEILRANLFPLKTDRIKLDEIKAWTNALVKHDLIILYENNSRPYIQLVTFNNHNKARAAKSKFPAFDDDSSQIISSENSCEQAQADSSVFVFGNRIRKSESKNTSASERKQKYADFVKMTEDEYQKLVAKFGEAGAKDKIEALNLWKGSKGKQTASDYLTILNWDRRDKKEHPPNDSLEQEAARLWHTEVLSKAGSIKPDWSSAAVLAGVRAAGGGRAIADTRKPEDLKKQFIAGYLDYRRREAG